MHVVRDDYLIGGTKQRALAQLLLHNPCSEFVYAGPVYGFAQIALSYCAKVLGKAGESVPGFSSFLSTPLSTLVCLFAFLLDAVSRHLRRRGAAGQDATPTDALC